MAEYFGLSQSEALAIIQALQGVLSEWRIHASNLGIKKEEIDRMASAFSLVKT